MFLKTVSMSETTSFYNTEGVWCKEKLYLIWFITCGTWMGFVFEAGFNMWFLMEQRLDDLGRWFIMWYLMDPTKGSNIYACVYVDTWLTAWRRQQIFRPCYITMHTLIFSSLRAEKLKLWKASMQVAVARFDQSVTVFGHVAWEPTWASHTAASSGFICLGNVQNWAYSLHAAHMMCTERFWCERNG